MCNCNNTTTTTTTICQEPVDCTCKVFLSTDCITLSEDLPCSGILKGQTETEVLKQLSEYICTKFDSVTNFFEIINAGTTGARVYKGVNILGKKEMRRLVDSNLINIVEGTNDITISVDETALATLIVNTATADSSETKIVSGTPNVVIEGNGTEGDEYVINVEQPTASNVGTGAQVFKGFSSNDYKFRKIKSIDNSVTIVEGTDDINLSVAIPDGSETKIQQGANVTIEGDGTAIDPYIINAVNTTTAYLPGTGISIVANTVNNTAPDRIVAITGSGATTVTGTYPNFTISSPNTTADDSETKINNGITTVKSGLGTTASPYVIETVNLQKVITTNYILTNADNEYTIFINSASPVTITLYTSVTIPNFCVGFIQEGIGDVTFIGTGVTLINPIGLKSKGQGYHTFIERKLITSEFYLLGNTKPI